MASYEVYSHTSHSRSIPRNITRFLLPVEIVVHEIVPNPISMVRCHQMSYSFHCFFIDTCLYFLQQFRILKM